LKTLVEKNKLLQLIQYDDERVRDAASEALTKFFCNTNGVIEIFLNAIEIFPNECLSLLASLKYFIPTDDDIIRILKLLNNINPKENSYNLNMYFHLKNCFIEFPFEIIERNQKIISFNKELSDVLTIALNREKIKSKDPDELWRELDKLCSSYNNEDLESNDKQYANLLYEGLLRHPSIISHKVIMSLSVETESKYHFEEYMVQLAEKFKLEETIPSIFRIYEKTDYMHIVNGLCVRALGSIGGLKIVDSIKNKYNFADESHKTGLISILKYIPFTYSEDIAIELLKNEKSKTNKTFLSGVLCDIFSLTGMEYVLSIIKKKEYDPQISHLIDYVIPVYIYYKNDYSNLQSVESEDKNFIENEQKNDPVYQAFEPLRKYFEKISENEFKHKENESITKKDNVIKITNSISKRKSKRRKKRK